MDVDVRFVGGRLAKRFADRPEELIRAEESQSLTSIGTSRKRAWAAP